MCQSVGNFDFAHDDGRTKLVKRMIDVKIQTKTLKPTTSGFIDDHVRQSASTKFRSIISSATIFGFVHSIRPVSQNKGTSIKHLIVSSAQREMTARTTVATTMRQKKNPANFVSISRKIYSHDCRRLPWRSLYYVYFFALWSTKLATVKC